MARYRPSPSAVIVTHAFVMPTGALALWAETSEPAPSPPGVTGQQARPHPFAIAPPVDGPAVTATLLLPSTRSTPLASPESGRRQPRGEVRIRPWVVPAVLVDPGSDPEQLIDQESGVVAGAGVGHLADAVAFATDLIRRGRVLPSLVDDPNGGLRAQWRAALYGVDAARLSDLARTTPAVAFAGGAWSPPQALQALLDHQIDALVRNCLVEPLLPSDVGESVTHTWLRALTGPRPQVVGDAVQLRQLREQLDEWHRSGAPAALRVCFRLTYVEEGPDDDEAHGWLLEFLVQPLADPSVLIPARHVWSDLSPALLSWLDVDDERAVDPSEILLAGLGRASRLYPDLDDALHQAQPIGLALDAAGAYRFLTHAPLLAEAGFGVLLPAAWQQPTRLGLSLEVHTGQDTHPVLRDEAVDHDTVVDYRWRLALGPHPLDDADLQLLAQAKVPLVRLRGRWVYLDEAQLAAGLAFLTRRHSGQLPVAEVLRLVGLAPQPDLPLPVTGVGGSGWLADLLCGRHAEHLALVEPPRSLATALRPYQLRGLSWLAFLDRLGVGALLADDMGLGKTVQLLALEAWLRERGARPPTLIVCPLSVLGNWQRESARFTPRLTVHVHHGPARQLPSAADLVLTTYQVAASDVDSLGRVAWDRIVLDEAQHVKNSATITARAIRNLPARHRIALTGTPVENRLAELWSIMDFLNPGLLGRLSTFRARYSVPIERYGDAGAAARLRRATGPFLLRRLKTDQAVIADLPEKLERIQWCNLTAEQATLYRAVIDELALKLAESQAGMPRKGLILSAITKLKQVCNHPAHLLGDGSPLSGRSGKIDRLEEILTNALADGDRAVVFTQFARLGTMLTPYLSARLGARVAFLHGGTRKSARDELVQRFGHEDGPSVLLVSVKAGGTGLNLTAANHVVHVDRWWNPATEAQATDRAFRIGQRRDVQVHTLVCLGTIEERIHQLIGQKRGLAQLAVGSGDGWLTTLSAEDLLDVIALRPEVIDG